MGNGSSIHEQSGGSQWWVKYCRSEWRSERSKQLDELLGLQRPALRRGQSSANLEELVRKLTSEPLPLLNESEDNQDLKTAIAKLTSGNILHTEKRAIERLLAQRYEDALAIAAAAADTTAEGVGGASGVLGQVLAVLHNNSLATELDRSGVDEPAEWRVRVHTQRRRAFLVVRSMVRLKREVRRLSAPISELGWLVPVAASERWGELKALAAKYRQLEEALQDTEVAVSQLSQLRDGPGKGSAPGRITAAGRASPQRVPRGSVTGGGLATGGRAVSESGAINSRNKTRAALTADPPPPPVAGVRGGRRQGSSGADSGPGGGGGHLSAPLLMQLPSPGGSATPLGGPRTTLNGIRKGTPEGANGGSAGPLVPTLSAQRSGSGPTSISASVSTLNGLYNRRLSVSGGNISPSGTASSPFASGGGGGILAAAPQPTLPSPTTASQLGGRMSAPGSAPRPASPAPMPSSSPRLPREPTLTRSGTGSGSGPPTAGPPQVRPSLPTNDGSGPPTPPQPPQPHPPPHNPLPANTLRVAQILDLTTFNPTAAHHYSVPFEPDVNHCPTLIPPGRSLLPEPPAAGTAAAGGGAGGPHKLELMANGNGNGNGLHRTALNTILNGIARSIAVEPSPPAAPPPTAGARRPLGALSHSSPAPLRGAAAAAAGGGGGAASDGPAALILEGESVDQALARFKLQSEDTRNALVDTARQFRAVLDLCNSAWPDQRWWLSAHTQEEAAMEAWPATDEYVVGRADIVRCLKVGAVAFQFFCAADEPLVGPGGSRFDLWTSDPWELAADLAGDKVAEAAAQRPPSERIVGLPLGVRVLQQLANSVAEVAGPQALDQLPIILHISERQRETIAADVLQYGIYRRLRRNLYIVVQRSQPVMRYNAAEHAYLPDPDQPQYLPGTGFSMLQLLWPGAALVMNDGGALERMPTSIMEELRARPTEWFVSRNAQDLSLLLEDGALDIRSLAYVSHMWNTPHMRYSMVVEATSTYVKHRDMILQYGSVLLCRKPKVSGMVLGRLDGAVRVDRYGGPAKPQLPVVELLTCELNSEHMQGELTQIATSRGAATSVGIGRYVFRFEVLSGLLTGPTVLRPKLLPLVDTKAVRLMAPSLRRRASMAAVDDHAAGWAALIGDTRPMFPFPTPGSLSEAQLAFAASQGLDTLLLRLQLSMTDLTMHHASKVVALTARKQPVFVRGPQDGSKLVEVLVASDQALGGAAERLAAKLPSFARQNRPGQNILVFVQDNSVSLTATNVAAGLVRRERGDRIHLVAVVPSEAQKGEGANLMERLLKAFRTHVDVATHVLSQDGRGLLECLADVAAQQRCGLIVVGSSSITAVAAVTPRNVPLVLPGMGPSRSSGMATAGGASFGRGGGGATAGGGGGGGAPLLDESSSEMLLSSVALSILRTFALPVIVVTANTKTYLKRHGNDVAVNGGRPARLPVGGVGGASSGRLSCMAVVDRHSRPMMHHLARNLLEPSLRQDALTLTQLLPLGLAPGNAGYDPGSIQSVALKTLMANFESIAAANDFHTPNKVYTQGDWHNALCIAARDHGAQLLCVQLAPGSTKSLPASLLQLIRSAPCPVMVYPERALLPGSADVANEGAD